MTLKGTPKTKKKLAPLLTPSLTPIYPNKRLDWDKENYDPTLHKFSPTYEHTLSEKESMRSSLSKSNFRISESDSVIDASPTKDIISSNCNQRGTCTSIWTRSLSSALADITHIYDSTNATLLDDIQTPSVSRIGLSIDSTPQRDDREIRRFDESSISPVSDILYEDLEWSHISIDRIDSTPYRINRSDVMPFIDHSQIALSASMDHDPPPLREKNSFPTYREAAQRRLRRGLR